MYRTHNNGELRIENVNETVTLKIYRNKKIKDIKVTLSKTVE